MTDENRRGASGRQSDRRNRRSRRDAVPPRAAFSSESNVPRAVTRRRAVTTRLLNRRCRVNASR